MTLKLASLKPEAKDKVGQDGVKTVEDSRLSKHTLIR
jgi:hypothetical protein